MGRRKKIIRRMKIRVRSMRKSPRKTERFYEL
jgi:hypothetical protein